MNTPFVRGTVWSVLALAVFPSLAHAATYTYDGADRVASVSTGGSVVTYRYDGEGNLTRRCVNASCVDVVVDDDEVVVGDSSGAKFLYSPTGVLASAGSSGPVSYMLVDEHGSRLGGADTAGVSGARTAYSAFGQVRTTPPPLAIGYNGEYAGGEDGTVWLRARSYDPGSGRFLGRDDFPGDESAPTSLNRYAFAEGNPISNVDSSGNSAEPVAGRLIRYDSTSAGQSFHSMLVLTDKNGASVAEVRVDRGKVGFVNRADYRNVVDPRDGSLTEKGQRLGYKEVDSLPLKSRGDVTRARNAIRSIQGRMDGTTYQAYGLDSGSRNNRTRPAGTRRVGPCRGNNCRTFTQNVFDELRGVRGAQRLIPGIVRRGIRSRLGTAGGSVSGFLWPVALEFALDSARVPSPRCGGQDVSAATALYEYPRAAWDNAAKGYNEWRMEQEVRQNPLSYFLPSMRPSEDWSR